MVTFDFFLEANAVDEWALLLKFARALLCLAQLILAARIQDKNK